MRKGLRYPAWAWTLWCCVTPAAPASAQQRAPAGKVVPVVTARARGELWNWFGSDPQDDYGYVNLLLRIGLQQQRTRLGWRLEFAAPLVLGAPDQASYGHGASYYRANGDRRTIAAFYPKQAYLTVGVPSAGHRLRLGRFEFSEGGEVTPHDATLAALKRRSVVQRQLGPFGFTQGGRSLDGLEYGWTGHGLNVTVVGAIPTVGVFSLDGWSNVAEMPLGYAAVTGTAPWAPGRSEWRVFTVGYRDTRGLVKADNRPLTVRAADDGPIGIVSLGGHLLQLLPTSSGPVDLALWATGQGGTWGSQRHRAWAADLEVGWQPRGLPLRPWLRAGLFTSSGDRDSADATHGTFFQALATPRLYARFPFYNLMNLRDWSLSVTLRPTGRVTLRADVRALELGSVSDGWYAGSGAYDTRSFGISIRPSGGARRLGTLVDLSANLRVTPHWTLSAYGAVAPSGPVIRTSSPSSSPGGFGFLELEYRR